LGSQPTLVRYGPRFAAAIDDALPQQQVGHPVPNPHQITADILTGPH